MAITAHLHQIYIAADASQVWTALVDSDWTRRWFHGTAFVSPPAAGRGYRTVLPDGSPAVEGMVEELVPPGDGTPGRLVQTWRVLYDAALGAEPPSRVEWTVEAAGPGLTLVRVRHGDLARSPRTWAETRDGWVWVLASLKSVLETGRPLPRAAARPPAPDVPADGDWHRAQAVEANNDAWELLERGALTPDEQEEVLRRAYAAAYHWQRARGAEPANEARACYLVAKALLAAARPTAALASARRALAVCERHGLDDFDLAYAHEACARALVALRRPDEAAAAWAAATAVPVADPEDREIVLADFAGYPD
ncbi:Uncharacterized conserved protein YndB, AHSA1/START domain [Friedmanniella luteola]|uniref:Uncharacterized conserved protein YndB, AHSA1/START domain n=1 Tax=Friedmanniella luteola TaxID=546871 RepID=A0A1H1PS83_9ACTN|nr:SRPBCC domain-containing protein [Friedmanniella luteola]SDS14015.1 Uncharacterized conserved protein YndB, AHSA1/START domain [Friedmanniella luteola]